MAAFFWIGSGGNSNWNQIGNWSATSGGSSNGAIPSVTSDVTFNGVGANGNTASTVNASISCLSLTFTSGYTNTVTINTAVVLTIAGNFTDNAAHSWVVSGTGAMTISAASTITSGGKTFPGPVTFTGTNTKTLSGNWTISGTLTLTGTTAINWTTNETLTCAGASNSTAAQTAGTAKLVISGGTLNGSNAFRNDIDLTAGGGGITVNNVHIDSSKTLTYVSGTISGTLALTLDGSCTLNTNGISWASTTVNAVATITINSLLTVAGTLTLSANNAITFAGTSVWSCLTLADASTAATTITLKNSLTYTIATAFTAPNSRTGSILLFTSDDATLRANLVLSNASTTCNVLASFTRIDASAGRPILTFNGVVTDSPNVAAFTNVLFNPTTTFNRGFRRFGLWDVSRRVLYQ